MNNKTSYSGSMPIMTVTGCWPLTFSGSYIPSKPPETDMEKALRIYEEKRLLKEKIAKFRKFSLTSDNKGV